MAIDRPRLRDGHRSNTVELYPLNEIPEDVIVGICGHIVYLSATGREDLTGDDFGDALARAVGGIHHGSPIGIADVTAGKMAWSAKTIKNKKPFCIENVPLISGRNSPDYSYGIENPHDDIQKTGDVVLKIWNERVNIAYSEYNPVRTMVLIRNYDLTEFVLYEEEARQFAPSNYEWVKHTSGSSKNPSLTFWGLEKQSGEHCFTWQPHGSQFTILEKLPSKVFKFEVKKPRKIDENAFLMTLKYGKDWVHILK